MKGLRLGVQQSELMSGIMSKAPGCAENNWPFLATAGYYRHPAGDAAPAQSIVSPETSMAPPKARWAGGRNSLRKPVTAGRRDPGWRHD
jgi:hypothetical protein